MESTMDRLTRIGRIVPLLAIVLAAAVTLDSQAPGATGSIVGCAFDVSGERLPGVTVLGKAGGVEQSTVTDDRGCYELRDLPPGAYRVTARFQGFDNVTRDRFGVAASTPSRLDFTMQVSRICECVRVAGSLAEHRVHAEAVLHMRLSESDPAASTPRGYYRHSATVLAALKEPEGGRPGRVYVTQNQRKWRARTVRCRPGAGGVPRGRRCGHVSHHE
jgi:Carboxypeptidase regulatory-like domain